MNAGKIAGWAQNRTDIIAQLKKAGITPSNNKLNPLANQELQKFFKSPKGQEARAMNVIALNGIKGGPHAKAESR